MESKIDLEVEAHGFDDVTENAERLSDALENLPAKVNIKYCKGCTININVYGDQHIRHGENMYTRPINNPIGG